MQARVGCISRATYALNVVVFKLVCCLTLFLFCADVKAEVFQAKDTLGKSYKCYRKGAVIYALFKDGKKLVAGKTLESRLKKQIKKASKKEKKKLQKKLVGLQVKITTANNVCKGE